RHGARDPVDRRAGRWDIPGRRRHRPVPRPARQPGDRRTAGARDGVRTAHRDDRAGRRRLRIGGSARSRLGAARIAASTSATPRRPPLTILQAIVLGITQGVTEFAPVSSSGHLIIVPWLFDWPILTDPNLNKTFDVALHLGTLVGALGYFRHDVARYAAAWFRSISARRIGTTDERLAWALVVGTIPAVIVGATLESFIQDELGQPWLIAVMLVVFGVVLYAVDRIAASRRHLEDLGVRDGLVLGVAQALALQPGVSRSGVTMTAARVLTFDRETAARFSFLLSLPVLAIVISRTGSPGAPPEMRRPVAPTENSPLIGFAPECTPLTSCTSTPPSASRRSCSSDRLPGSTNRFVVPTPGDERWPRTALRVDRLPPRSAVYGLWRNPLRTPADRSSVRRVG